MEIKDMLKIKELREEKNWQQKDVAQRVNRTVACVSSWETGKTEPSIEDVLRLADIFEVSCDYLLGRTNEMDMVESSANLSPLQKEVISLFDGLSRDNQFRVLGFIQAL